MIRTDETSSTIDRRWGGKGCCLVSWLAWIIAVEQLQGLTEGKP